MRPDLYMDVFDVRSRDEIEVAASSEVTYRSVMDLDLARSLPAAVLFAIRGLPHLVTGKVRPSRSFRLQDVLDAGFVILEEDAPRGLVVGAVGKFWRLDSGIVRVTPDEFHSFDAPGFARAVLAFTVDELDRRRSLLATETRVACTDASARRKFSLYWRAIGPFSGMIRRIMLDQVKRSAERAPAVV